MGQVLLLLVVALTVAAVVFGVTVLVTGRDPGLAPAEPDGQAVPLPGTRPLRESDIGKVRFDTALRGYRMAQVDQAMRRAAYDIGYKSELIEVLEAEVTALRAGRTADADALRRARERAAGAQPATPEAGDGPTAAAPGTNGATPVAASAGGQGVAGSGAHAAPADASADDTALRVPAAAAGDDRSSGDDPDDRPSREDPQTTPDDRSSGDGERGPRSSGENGTELPDGAGEHGPVVRSESA